jgi:tetratricopeptide (TPR) repeat protein
MFYGVGGNGKSSLLDHLQQQSNNFGVSWATINLEDLRDAAQALPHMYLHLKAAYGFRFKRFERTHLIYHLRQGLATRTAGQPEELVSKTSDFLFDAFTLLVPYWAQIAVAAKLGKNAVEIVLKTRKELEPLGGDASELKRLCDVELSEFWEELIDAFAGDLIATAPSRQGPGGRCVLYFDNHEALWRDAHGGAASQDGWIRRLRETVHNHGVLMVLAGRDQLDWGADWNETDSQGRNLWLKQHAVNGLSRTDALKFLKRCDVNNREIQEAILRVTNEATSEKPSAHHCFLLALCAEIVANTKSTSRQYPDPAVFNSIPSGMVAMQPLTDRFLRSLPNQAMVGWLEELALAPRFDETFALTLDVERHHHNGRSGWNQLLKLSLIERQTNGFVEMHKLFRGGLMTRTTIDVQLAVHKIAFEHLSTRTDHREWTIRGWAWYHHRFLDHASAMRNHDDALDDAIKHAKPHVLEALINWWSDVELSNQANPLQKASDLCRFGSLLRDSSLGQRTDRLGQARGLFLNALEVYTVSDHPSEWASIQNDLGLVFIDLPAGDREQNLKMAILHFENALTIHTEFQHPIEWSSIQNRLGISYGNFPTGDRTANLEKAIKHLQNALKVRTKSSYPSEWATTKNNLGLAYFLLRSHNRNDTIEQAIQHLQDALEVHTQIDFPIFWSRIQNNLGLAYYERREGDRTQNLKTSIHHFKNSLQIRTEADFQIDWALTQTNLGDAYLSLPSDHLEDNLDKASQCFSNALTVLTEDQHPGGWGFAQWSIGYVWIIRGNQTEAKAAWENAERAFRTNGFHDRAQEVYKDIQTFFGNRRDP